MGVESLLVTKQKNILSIDLGGSSAKVALINQDGKIVKRFQKIETIPGENIIKNLKTEIFKQDKNVLFDAVGFATAGMLNIKEGLILIAGNLKLKNFPIVKKLQEAFSKPSFIINDANAATLGENWMGSGANASSLILYTIGTGIGGGIIINDELITGFNGTAGELGHGGNFQSKVSCNCGLKNCLEPVSSAPRLKLELRNLTPSIELNQVTNEMLKTNKDIRDVFKKVWDKLTDHMSIMIYALNPEVVLIGGGVSNIGDEIKQVIWELLKEKVSPEILKGLTISLTSLGNDAGIYGAAKNALLFL